MSFLKFVVNLDSLQAYSVGRRSGKTFIGPPAKGAYWGYSWMDSPDKIEASIGEVKGTYDPRFKNPGRYLGTLDARSGTLRFVTASEKPEEHIRTQDEQSEEMDKAVEQVVPPDRQETAPASR